MVAQETVHVHTRGHGEMHDLTAQVEAAVVRSGIRTGVVHVCNLGSTAAIATIEFEPGLQRDLPELLDRLIPPSRTCGHEQTWHDGNGHSHLQATWLGQSFTAPVSAGRLRLGRWQQIVLLECDIHARQREVVVTVIGEQA